MIIFLMAASFVMAESPKIETLYCKTWDNTDFHFDRNYSEKGKNPTTDKNEVSTWLSANKKIVLFLPKSDPITLTGPGILDGQGIPMAVFSGSSGKTHVTLRLKNTEWMHRSQALVDGTVSIITPGQGKVSAPYIEASAPYVKCKSSQYPYDSKEFREFGSSPPKPRTNFDPVGHGRR